MTSSAAHFEQVYISKSEEDLLELWLRRDSLDEDAAAALQLVIAARKIDLVSLAAEQSEVDFRSIEAAGEQKLASERRGQKLFWIMAAVAGVVLIFDLFRGPVVTLERAFEALIKAGTVAVLLGLLSAAINFSRTTVKDYMRKQKRR